MKISKSMLLLALPLLVFQVACAQNQSEQKQENKEKEVVVLIETSYGNIKVKLYNETPLHRDNFIKLVNEHYYDSVLFHRVINQFMIQAGDPDSKGAKPGIMLGVITAGFKFDGADHFHAA